ncbi:MAG: hypothetical protein JST94_08830 [Bacteroidetes bacterium]|nr:hypothetical protein [Bacteroidota bacterium]MBS1639674.1 hypothetical protein [Bacteroidota bacterium]MBS1642463.1 hypothetical protein [Bacteroidota bacterium]MBS1671537.1 hypothetical protein [Bacteroidota bacterium]
MDIVISFLHNHINAFYLIGAIVLLLKLLVVIGYKGFDFVQIIFSFVHLYNIDRIETEKRMNKTRAFLMSCNNLLNLLFYIWLIIIIIYLFVTSNLNEF